MVSLKVQDIAEEITGLRFTGVDKGLRIGSFRFKDTPPLALLVLDEYAKRTGKIPTCKAFDDLLREEKFTEKKPDIHDPRFKINSAGLPPKVQQAKQLYFFKKANDQYNKRHRHHEKKSERQRRIISACMASSVRYISFACNPSFATGETPPFSLDKENCFFLPLPRTSI